MAPRESAHQRLWQALGVGSWPLPLHGLPTGTALVGGAVRDGLIGRLGERPDLDLVVPGDGVALARQLAQSLGGTAVELDRERCIGRLVLKGWTLDFAQQAGNTLVEDLLRRDFTVNAMALRLPLGGEGLVLIDPLDGLGDLERHSLRALSETNLLEDPLRLLRGVRLAAELGFNLTRQTWEWIGRHRTSLGTVAGERVLAELERLVAGAHGARGVELLWDSGLLDVWTRQDSGPCKPPPPTTHLTWEQARLRGLTEEESQAALPVARLAALLDETTLRALHASNRLRMRCRHLRRWRQRLAALGGTQEQGLKVLPEAEQLELLRQLGRDLPALLLELPQPGTASALLRWRDSEDPLFHPHPPRDGLALQKQLGLPPGPKLGDLLAHLTAERAFGRLPPDPTDEQILTAANRWLAATGDPRHD